MDLLIAIGLLTLGFVILIKGADFLVDGASALAKRFNISDMVVGLTIVAFGTSMPELVISANAAMGGKSALVLGNVLGSNIYNIILILGVSGAIYPLIVQKTTFRRELPFSIFITFLAFFLANDVMLLGSNKNLITTADGIILLMFFGVFLYYVYSSVKNNPDEPQESIIEPMPLPKSFLFMGLGLIGLIYGGDLVVQNAEFLALKLGLTPRVVALTVIAIGTSLPELATSVVAALKKNSDIAVGNVVGSNIFNILLVLASSVILAPTPVNYDTAANVDFYVLFLANIILAIFLLTGKTRFGDGGAKLYLIDRWQAGILVLIAIVYTTYLVLS